MALPRCKRCIFPPFVGRICWVNYGMLNWLKLLKKYIVRFFQIRLTHGQHRKHHNTQGQWPILPASPSLFHDVSLSTRQLLTKVRPIEVISSLLSFPHRNGMPMAGKCWQGKWTHSWSTRIKRRLRLPSISKHSTDSRLCPFLTAKWKPTPSTPTDEGSSNIERRDHRKAERKRLYLR